jgi:hypothetical protein
MDDRGRWQRGAGRLRDARIGTQFSELQKTFALLLGTD